MIFQLRSSRSCRGRAAVLAAAVLASACSTEIGQRLGDDIKSTLQAQGVVGEKAVDQHGLRNILPQFDPALPVDRQWPHVAVTVLKSPPMWADLAADGRGKGGAPGGCFTLRLVVWTSATASKVAGPFDWCSPRDVEIRPRSGGFVEAEFNAIARPVDLPGMSGIERTDGPRPPRTLAPADRATAELQARNSATGSTTDLSRDVVSKFGQMFLNLRHAMGATLREQDFRVWVVAIRG